MAPCLRSLRPVWSTLPALLLSLPTAIRAQTAGPLRARATLAGSAGVLAHALGPDGAWVAFERMLTTVRNSSPPLNQVLSVPFDGSAPPTGLGKSLLLDAFQALEHVVLGGQPENSSTQGLFAVPVDGGSPVQLEAFSVVSITKLSVTSDSPFVLLSRSVGGPDGVELVGGPLDGSVPLARY